MRRSGWLVAAMSAMGLALAVWVGQATSQEGGPPPGGPGMGPGAGGPGRFMDPERMRQMRVQRLKERLGATDQEWQVLEPRIQKIMALQRETMAGLMMGMRSGRRMPGRPDAGRTGPAGAPQAGQGQQASSDVAQKLADLNATLENKDAPPDEIKAKLAAYREAREKVRQELTKARAELKEIVTQRQEATLVVEGLLE